MAARKKATRRKKVEAASRGLTPAEMTKPGDTGFESPYLRNFVVARIRPFRPRGKPAPDAEALLDHMEQAAAKFDSGKIRSDQVARTAGAGE